MTHPNGVNVFRPRVAHRRLAVHRDGAFEGMDLQKACARRRPLEPGAQGHIIVQTLGRSRPTRTRPAIVHRDIKFFPRSNSSSTRTAREDMTSGWAADHRIP